jgi:hypothetical protein
LKRQKGESGHGQVASPAIGAIGENIGALAVVISVIYLAVQIRKQTDASRLAATRELPTLYIDFLKPSYEDKELSSLYLRAVQHYDDLSRDDRFRVAMYLQTMMRTIEQHFVHIQQHKVDQVFIDSINLAVEEWLTFPGAQRWWDLSKDMFVPQFREHIDNMIEIAKVQGYSSSFQEA